MVPAIVANSGANKNPIPVIKSNKNTLPFPMAKKRCLLTNFVLSENEKVSYYKKETSKFFEAKAAFHASVADEPAQYRELKDKYYIFVNM